MSAVYVAIPTRARAQAGVSTQCYALLAFPFQFNPPEIAHSERKKDPFVFNSSVYLRSHMFSPPSLLLFLSLLLLQSLYAHVDLFSGSPEVRNLQFSSLFETNSKFLAVCHRGCVDTRLHDSQTVNSVSMMRLHSTRLIGRVLNGTHSEAALLHPPFSRYARFPRNQDKGERMSRRLFATL